MAGRDIPLETIVCKRLVLPVHLGAYLLFSSQLRLLLVCCVKNLHLPAFLPLSSRLSDGSTLSASEEQAPGRLSAQNLNRYLVCCTADTSCLNFKNRHHVFVHDLPRTPGIAGFSAFASSLSMRRIQFSVLRLSLPSSMMLLISLVTTLLLYIGSANT